MIDQATASKLIKIYFYVCEKYESDLQYHCQRFTNNRLPDFTDQEVMTIYLFAVHQEKLFRIKQIYSFVKNYFSDWFPKLPSYVAFSTRLNRLSGPFRKLAGSLLEGFTPGQADRQISLLDSMPIITCSGKRQGKVARELTDKGFCPTKNLYCYGLKLHVMGFDTDHQMPHPESIVLSKASETTWPYLNRTGQRWQTGLFSAIRFIAIKAFLTSLDKTKTATCQPPVKLVKGGPEVLRQYDRAFNDLCSKAVSTVRQPIELSFG